MRRNEWLATLNHPAAIRLERIRGIVKLNLENEANEKISDAVYEQLKFRIIHCSATLHEPTTKNTIPALV